MEFTTSLPMYLKSIAVLTYHKTSEEYSLVLVTKTSFLRSLRRNKFSIFRVEKFLTDVNFCWIKLYDTLFKRG